MTVSRHQHETERVFVKDNGGYIEVHDHNLIWHNPDLYVWINSASDESCMLYFFELISPD